MSDGEQVTGTNVTESTTPEVEVKPDESGSVETAKNEVAVETQEKMLKQSEVNEVVGSVKRSAYEKGRNDALASVEIPQSQSESKTTQSNDPSSGISKDEIRKIFAEEQTLVADKIQATRILDEFIGKIECGKAKHPDYEESVATLNIHKAPWIIRALNAVDNTADVLYDLSKNPFKYQVIKELARDNEKGARIELGKLAGSIKKNEAALKNRSDVPEPLEQVKSSNAGVDNGNLSVRDMQSQSFCQ